MKISIDFDGTLWEHQDFFRSFQKAMKAGGHTVGVLTAHSSTIQQRDYDLMVARGFIVPDFGIYAEYNEAEIAMRQAERDNEVIVGHYKARSIISNNIDIHFDDNASYIRKWLNQWNADTPHHRVFTSPVDSHIPS